MPLPATDSPGWNLFGGTLDPAIQIRRHGPQGYPPERHLPLAPSSKARGGRSECGSIGGTPRQPTNRRVGGHYPLFHRQLHSAQLQDIDLALKEFDHAVFLLRFELANVSSTLVVFIWAIKSCLFLGSGPRSQSHRPETMAMTPPIYEGIFEAFPDVTVVIVHGGEPPPALHRSSITARRTSQAAKSFRRQLPLRSSRAV